MWVYYAEFHQYADVDFIGVFSTTEKAQAACLEHDPDQQSLEWKPFGDCAIATNRYGDDYYITPLEVDAKPLTNRERWLKDNATISPDTAHQESEGN